MSDAFSTITAELPRDRWGRPLISPPDGGDPVAYQRVTTFVKALDDTFHLSQWGKRMVVLGMAARRDLVLAASAINDPNDYSQKRTLNDIAKQAVDAAQGSAAATTGTALHSFTERIDRNEPLGNVPEEYEADLAAYAEIIKPFRVRAIEGFCVVDDLRVGGSYDRILELPAGGLTAPDGSTVEGCVIGDLKTGKSVSFGMLSIAQQLAVYANAQDYDHTLGTRKPLEGNPSKDWAIVVHLPAGTGRAELVWVDIAAGWHIASTVTPLVHEARKRKDLSAVFASASAAPAAGPSLVEQVNAAPDYAALKALYAANAAVWTPGLTSLAAARRVALEGGK